MTTQQIEKVFDHWTGVSVFPQTHLGEYFCPTCCGRLTENQDTCDHCSQSIDWEFEPLFDNDPDDFQTLLENIDQDYKEAHHQQTKEAIK